MRILRDYFEELRLNPCRRHSSPLERECAGPRGSGGVFAGMSVNTPLPPSQEGIRTAPASFIVFPPINRLRYIISYL